MRLWKTKIPDWQAARRSPSASSVSHSQAVHFPATIWQQVSNPPQLLIIWRQFKPLNNRFVIRIIERIHYFFRFITQNCNNHNVLSIINDLWKNKWLIGNILSLGNYYRSTRKFSLGEWNFCYCNENWRNGLSVINLPSSTIVGKNVNYFKNCFGVAPLPILLGERRMSP